MVLSSAWEGECCIELAAELAQPLLDTHPKVLQRQLADLKAGHKLFCIFVKGVCGSESVKIGTNRAGSGEDLIEAIDKGVETAAQCLCRRCGIAQRK